MTALLDDAMKAADPSLPSLVCLPEYLGMYLSFIPRYREQLQGVPTLLGAVERILELGGEQPGDRRAAAQQLLFVEHALETEAAYVDCFSSLAARHGIYLLAGSLCVPELDESPHRGGRIVLDGTRVYNTSYLFSPRGRCLQRVAKVNIPPGENLLFDAAPASQLVPAETAIGRIGTLLCFDGYHHRPVERYDAAGVELLLQPVYFGSPDVRFDGSGKVVPRPFDFVSLIQGRENIRYGMSSAMVGAVFDDKRAEGLSFIARNSGRADTHWEEAILARAEDPYAEAILTAVVETDG